MNWDAISAIGEIVGATAVVITLGYLAIQIRDSTRIARSATRQAIASMAFSQGNDLVSDRSLTEALIKDFKGEDVDETDWVRLLAHNYMAMRHYENIHYQYLAGMIEPDEWRGFRRNLSSVLQWRSMQAYWDHEQHYYSDAFREEVGKIREDPAPAEMDHAYVLEPGRRGPA